MTPLNYVTAMTFLVLGAIPLLTSAFPSDQTWFVRHSGQVKNKLSTFSLCILSVISYFLGQVQSLYKILMLPVDRRVMYNLLSEKVYRHKYCYA